MRSAHVLALVLSLASLSILAPSTWAQTTVDTPNGTYTVPLRRTQNAPAGAAGTVTMEVKSGRTEARLTLTGLYPNTVYTLWTVFNVLECIACGREAEVPSSPATLRAGFPPEGNGVTPTAKLSAGFTSGMGPDPGLTVVTDANGNGKVTAELDFDLVSNAPVSNRDIILQCAPQPALGFDTSGRPVCPPGSRTVRVTTTWLRRYIGEFPLHERAAMCANYDPRFDIESTVYDAVIAKSQNAALWQCIDPARGLPRVYFFTFDHFRLANHPDDLTHGFIGGTSIDHWIDMVGRRCDMLPRPPQQPACVES